MANTLIEKTANRLVDAFINNKIIAPLPLKFTKKLKDAEKLRRLCESKVDDEIIGLKSTSIKFKKNYKLFLSICYSIFLIILILLGLIEKYSLIYFILTIMIFLQLFYFQIFKLDIKNPNSCLKVFKSNNVLGFLVFLNLILGKL